MTKKPRRSQGMNWISPKSRLALYIRDGFACVYCGDTIEDGATLTLDHLRPYSRGGTHRHSNLVTACKRCNSSRGKRPISDFVEAVASYLGRNPEEIQGFIRKTTRRKTPFSKAALIAKNRGSVKIALKIGL